MTPVGSRSLLPAPYRITVAIPLALLIHTLIFALIRFEPAVEDPEPEMIKITLSRTGSVATPATSTPTPNASEQVVEEVPQPTEAAPEILVSEESPQPTAQPEDSQPEPAQPATRATTTPSVEQVATIEDKEGDQGQTENTEQITQISEPAQQTSYIDLLAARIVSYATPYFNDAYRAELTAVTAVEVELQLMNNGALIGASITQPSGDAVLDRAAYRGALGASPYPEPPAGNKEGNRFRVTIKFAPERI
ncbi:energy transducer TonB [Marinobacter zhejiangensis]|uniref:Protein TonB n=1 Tax=Marinobacter zhejiangensis TaxID=488535 RepID=A0A1I4N8S1_9GAMM|nr:energy transducer TonB [Marinobacter zhejiangensis]SFM11670.1 protein TonB [Marinobacter zhejiangensis]